MNEQDTPTKPSPVIPRLENGYRTVVTGSPEHVALLHAGYVIVEHDDVHTILHENRRKTVSTERRRATDQEPHPDMVDELVGMLKFYAPGISEYRAEALVEKILDGAAAWHARRDARERQHATLRDKVTAWRDR